MGTRIRRSQLSLAFPMSWLQPRWFFDPQVGFHSVLVQSDASKAAFDFFTPAHVRYHFELEAGLQPYNKVFTLRSITDPNGNRISLYYSKDQPLDPHFGLSADLQSKLDDDSTTLDVVEDSAGRAFVFTYQMIFGEKRLVELKGYDPDSPTHDLLGLDIKYNYDDGYGNLTSVTRVGTLPDGSDARTDIYTYTPGDDRLSHNMLTHTVPGNGSGISTLTTTYDYYSQTSDTAGALPTEGTDPRINQYFQSLNLEGERIQAVHMPGGETGSSDESVTTFQYDFSGKTRTVSDPRSGVPATIYTLNAYGATVKIEAPEGRTTTMVWATPQTPHPEAFADGAGKGGKDIELVSITDADGQTTSYKYDNLGNAIEITTTFPTVDGGDAGGGIVAVTDGAGNPVSQTVIKRTYDATFDKLTSEIDAEGNTTTYVIDPSNGNTISASDAGGTLETNEFYAANTFSANFGPGDLLKTTDASLHDTKFLAYNAFGYATQIEDAVGIKTTRIYDVRGRLTDESDTSGHRTHYEYDGLDRLLSETTYDDLLHTTASPGVDWATRMVYTYFVGGQVKSTTDGLNQTTEYEYDQGNRLVRKTMKDVAQADGSVVTLQWQDAYDEDGNLVHDIDADGIVHQYTYDGLNRLKTIEVLSGPAGNQTSSVILKNNYDAINKISDTDLNGNTTTYTYDGLYRQVAATFNVPADQYGAGHASVKTQYDRVGNKIFQSDANGNGTKYVYNKDYTLKSATDALGNEIDYTYINRNLATETHLNSGLKIVYSNYDGRNQAHKIEQTVQRGGPGSLTDTYLTGYDADYANRTTTVTDPNGYKTLTQMDGLGRTVSQTVDAGGLNLKTTYTYDGNGNQATVSDPWNDDTDVTNTYDGLNRKIKTEYVQTSDDLRPPVEEYFYDGNSNLVRYIDKRGNTFESKYDNLNRVMEQTAPGAPLTVTSTSYDDQNNIVTVTDPNGKDTKYQYDALGRLILLVDPDNNTIQNTYDGVNLRSVVDKKGFETRFTYDADNRLILTENAQFKGGPALTTTKQIYEDAQNRVITQDRRFDETGAETIDQYDSLGRLTEETRSAPGLGLRYGEQDIVLTQKTYDGASNVLLSTDANGNTTEYRYDGANRLRVMIEAQGTQDEGTTTYDYNGLTDDETVSDMGPNGITTEATYAYDARYRLVSLTNGNGETTRYTYDENDNITSKTDPLVAGHVTRYEYDALDKLTEVDESSRGGGLTEYVYDANRNLRFETDADNHKVENRYDDLNRLTDTFLADGQHWHYGYDADNNENLVIDPENQRTDMVYDFLNRLQTVTYSAAVNPLLDYQPLSIVYAYDGNGNMKSSIEVKHVGSGSVTETDLFSYDELDRLTGSTYVNDSKTIAYTYDKVGNRTSVTDSDHLTTTYQFDHRNRLSVATTEDGDTRYQYYANGVLKLVVYPNGTVADYGYANSYDDANRLLYVVNRKIGFGQSLSSVVAGTTPSSDQLISSFTYVYDKDGNRKSQVEVHHGHRRRRSLNHDLFLRRVGPADAGQLQQWRPSHLYI